MAKLVIGLVISLFLHTGIDGLRILGIFPHTGRSQNQIKEPLMLALANRGHEVTVVSHFQVKNPPENFTQIDLSGNIPIWKHIFTFEQLAHRPFFGIEQITRSISIGKKLWSTGEEICEDLFSNEEVRALKKGHFDVAIVQQFNSDCGLGLAYVLGIPSIGISAHIMMPFVHSRLGFINHPAFVPNHFLGYGRKPTLYQTIQNTFIRLYMNYRYRLAQKTEKSIIQRHIGGEIPDLEDIAKNMSMLLVNTFYPLHGAYPSTPNIQEICGLHLKQPKPLPQDVESFLNDSERGVILFNMGSMVKSISWPEDKLRAFKEVFSNTPQRILWKWENDSMPSLPNNVKTMKWIPQFDILNHEKVEVFITHGGLFGMSEAVYCGVPMIVIPIFGDQFANAAAAEDSGVGVVLNYHDINKETVFNAIQRALHPEMKLKAKKLSSIFRNRQATPIETAVYWIEHVAKYGSAHLKSPHVDLPLYKFLLLDMISVLLFVSIVLLFVVYKILKCTFKKLLLKSKSKED